RSREGIRRGWGGGSSARSSPKGVRRGRRGGLGGRSCSFTSRSSGFFGRGLAECTAAMAGELHGPLFGFPAHQSQQLIHRNFLYVEGITVVGKGVVFLLHLG